MDRLKLYYENDTDDIFDFDIENISSMVILKTLEEHNIEENVSVSLMIVDEDTIKSINAENRDIDKVTDVLSFPNIEFENEGDLSILDSSDKFDYYDPEDGRLILGDIIICSKKVKEQADSYGHSEKREFAFLVAHSILHLLGYDHIDDDERELMEEKQRNILDSLKITRD